MSEERILLEADPEHAHVYHLILNRPEKKNALDGDMIQALHHTCLLYTSDAADE